MIDALEVLAIIGLYRMGIYALGDVHKEYNPQAILAWISYEIATLRLAEIKEPAQPLPAGKTLNDLMNRRAVMTLTVEQARMAGGWVNVFGYCPVCTSFWFMLAVVLPFYGWVWFGISLLLTKITIQWT